MTLNHKQKKALGGIAAAVAAVLILVWVTTEDRAITTADQAESEVQAQPFDTAAEDFAESLEQALNAPAGDDAVVLAGSPGVASTATDLYQSRDYQPLWLQRDGAPNDRFHDLLETLRGVERHGLLPEDYGYQHLQESGARIDGWSAEERQAHSGQVLALERQASLALAAVVQDMTVGRYTPGDVDARVSATVDLAPRSMDLQAVLTQVVDGDVDDEVEALAPDHPQYQALQQLLMDLHAQSQQELPTIQTRELLSRGQRNPELPTIRALLNVHCESCASLPEDGEDVELFDEAVDEAVRRYQEEQGLAVDGLIGGQTRELLNLRSDDKLERVRLNLDRWRWYDLPERYIQVNIPEFELRYYDGNQLFPRLKMRTIVGSADNPTPIFSDKLEYLVLRPYWNVPYSIATEELLPKLREDPLHFYEKNLQAVNGEGRVVSPYLIDWDRVGKDMGFRLRQEPGPHNSLGLIKFMMPNQYAVYLHDTNAPQLFEHSRRAFSHGCIRLEDPFGLARALKPGAFWWNRSMLARESRHKGPEEKSLDQPVPVYITYFSVVVDGNGDAQFYPDLYGLDAASAQVLAERGRTLVEDQQLAAH